MASKTTLPPLAPIPPHAIRISLGPDEWQACLDAWIALAEAYTIMQSSKIVSNGCTSFLVSYYHELATSPSDEMLKTPKAQLLGRQSFKLAGRALTTNDTPADMFTWSFVSDLCHAHIKNAALARLMNVLWKRKHDVLRPILQSKKDELTRILESTGSASVGDSLTGLISVMRASPDIAAFFMTGSDFLDAMASAYGKAQDTVLKKQLSIVTCVGLLALNEAEPKNLFLLSDHLYTLKSQANDPGSLIADVVTNTPLVARLRRSLSGKAADRLFKSLDELETFRTPSMARVRPPRRRQDAKGKGNVDSGGDGELHMHRMSLVTQIQDLFPDLGAGFVMRLLDEYQDDVEQVTAHLLDDSLPPYLSRLDRSEPAPIFDASREGVVDRLAPRSTPPPPETFIPDRRNVFDHDEFDRLEMDTRRLHVGKASKTDTTNQSNNKAAILSALAAFDSDDDERDDTYDVEDVGGTVDTAAPDGEPGVSAKVTQEANDMALFTTYQTNPELFGRTFDVRKGQARKALKQETGMTDEAIEGWAIMLQRDPRRLKKLEAQHGAFDGRQTSLGRSAYQESANNTETEDSDAPGSGREGARGGFRGRGRGRGSGGRGRGGDVAGSSSDPKTAAAQRRKETNKSSRANHNRRDQRARKMARGGFAG